jgi:hypothetical protein
VKVEGFREIGDQWVPLPQENVLVQDPVPGDPEEEAAGRLPGGPGGDGGVERLHPLEEKGVPGLIKPGPVAGSRKVEDKALDLGDGVLRDRGVQRSKSSEQHP